MQWRVEVGNVRKRGLRCSGDHEGLSKRVTSEEAPEGRKRARRRIREEGTVATV